MASAPAAGEPPEGARRLIDKLHTAGQLKAGFLLRVLHQGQIDVFELAFAKLLHVDHPRMRAVLYESGPRPVALACRAVGIDRCVSPPSTISRARAAACMPRSPAKSAKDVEAVFDSYSRAEAHARSPGAPIRKSSSRKSPAPPATVVP